MEKEKNYKQLLKGQERIHKTQDRIVYFQKLLKQKKYAEHKDIKAFIKGYISLLKKDYKNAETYFISVIELDDKFAYPYNGLGSAYVGLKDYDKAIELYNKAIEINDKSAYPYYGLGSAYYYLKDYDKAIEYYNKTISIDDKYVYTYNGLGSAYSNLREYNKAIEYFNKAIEIDDKYTDPYNNLGIVYKNLKDYYRAIEYLNKAIEIDDKYTSSYNNLGVVYKILRDYDKAIKYLNKAIEIDDKVGKFNLNLALTYEKMQDWQKANEFYEKAIELFKLEKENYWISITEKYLEEVKNKVESQNILKDKEKVSAKDKIVKLVLEEIQDSEIDKQVKVNKEKSLEFLIEKEKQQTSKDETYFEVLRRWNSYTPIVADNYHASKGGGYFIKIGEEGIVIDPGFNFIDNFRGKGHKFYEITNVLISHAHNDHTSDLESILTLLHKYNKNLKKTLPDKIGERDGKKIEEIEETEINKEFSEKRKIINFYITKSVFIKYSGLFDLYLENNYNIHIIEKDKKYEIIKEITFYTIEAKHNDIISDRDSVGFLLSFENTSLVYTGDTGWSEQIKKQYKKVARECKGKYILLIAHIGGFKEYELNYLNPNPEIRKKSLYKQHLGRIGLIRINELLNPKVCLISEFGEEFMGYRIKLAKIYQGAFDNKITFLPADIGLKFCLKRKQLEAITKIDIAENSFDLSYIDPEDVKSCLLLKDYSLHYFTEKSDFTELKLIQVIRENFEKSAR
jgi:tetratricopeptide (TPR) repeat protein/L-ascorbate metabolism protein UlaG (beta-lactamase superfamily)